MRKVYEIVGLTGDATLYCLPCARKAYGPSSVEIATQASAPDVAPTDREGNPLSPVFLSDLEDMFCNCMECGVSLYESEVV